jgi:hypothetical protein
VVAVAGAAFGITRVLLFVAGVTGALVPADLSWNHDESRIAQKFYKRNRGIVYGTLAVEERVWQGYMDA